MSPATILRISFKNEVPHLKHLDEGGNNNDKQHRKPKTQTSQKRNCLGLLKKEWDNYDAIEYYWANYRDVATYISSKFDYL